MSKRGLFCTVLALALLVVARAPAQDAGLGVDDLRTEVQKMRAEMEALRKSRADDRAQIQSLSERLETAEARANADPRVDEAINRLAQEGVVPLRSRLDLQSLTVFGKARVRANYAWNVYFLDSSKDDDGAYLDGLFNLGFSAQLADNVKVVFDMQAAGRFNNNTLDRTGVFTGSVATNPLDNVTLYQGYFEMDNLFGQDGRTFLRAGRQELIYGNQMLMGSDDFYAGTTHDALRVDYGSDGFSTSGFVAQEASPEDGRPGATFSGLGPTPSKNHDWMAGLYNTINVGDAQDPFGFDAYWLYFESHGDALTAFATYGTNHIAERSVPALLYGNFHTIGGRVFAGDKRLRDNLRESTTSYWASAEFAYQTGNGAGLDQLTFVTGRKLEGVAVEAFGAYRFDGDLKFTLNAGFHYMEGGKHNGDFGFQPLFIGTHETWSSRFGNMDEFPMYNAMVARLGATAWVTDTLRLGTNVIWGRFDNGNFNNYTRNAYGTEIDAYLNWYYTSQVVISANFSAFFAENNLAQPGGSFGFTGSDTAYLTYIQAQVQF